MIAQGKLVEDLMAVLAQRHNARIVSNQQIDAVIDAANILVKAFESPEDTILSRPSLEPVIPFPVQ